MNDTFRYTLIPVILGANLQARRWADRYLRQFRVRSYVMNEKHHFSLLLAFSLRFRKLSRVNGYTDFIISELLHLAQEHPDRLLVLIGATSHYRAMINQNKHILEKYYILSDPELSFLVRDESGDAEFYIKGERA